MNIHIIGAGLLGRLLAWRLSNQGHSIHIYDSGSQRGENSAGYVAAAMLAPTAEAIDATKSVIALGYQSIPLWREWIPRLPEKVFIQENGSLIVWHAQDKELAHRFTQHLRHGHHGQEVWQTLAQDDITQYEPQLQNRFTQGYYLPHEGQLDNRQTLHALAMALNQNQVHCHWNTPKEISEMKLNPNEWLIDCRGFGAKASWNRLPENHTAQLRGIRGEVARVYAPEVTLNRPIRLLHPRYPLYIAPKENHHFVIGATQIESEDQSPISVRSSLELMSALYAVHPAFGEARIEEYNVGLRPTLTHHNPEILLDNQQNILRVNGLFRHGFMISPAVVEASIEVLLTKKTNNQHIQVKYT